MPALPSNTAQFTDKGMYEVAISIMHICAAYFIIKSGTYMVLLAALQAGNSFAAANSSKKKLTCFADANNDGLLRVHCYCTFGATY